MALAGFSAGEAEGLRRAMSRKRSEEALLRPPRPLHRRRGRARGVDRGGRARLPAGRRLLGLRLPQGARGGVRAARLPVDLAARPLRAGVPVRAAERAADGLLPARLAGPRGAAARVRGAASRRQPQRGRVRRSRHDLAVRVGLGYVNGVRAEEMEALVAERERGGAYRRLADLASRSGAGREALEKLAWAGALERLAPRRRGEAASDVAVARGAGPLWRVGVAKAARAGGGQLSLPLAGARRRRRCASRASGTRSSPTTPRPG